MSRRSQPDPVGFLRSRPDALTGVVAGVLDRGGWVNVQADPEEVDPRALRRPSVFSARGRPSPLATLVPGRGTDPHQVGFEHGSGRRAMQRLQEAGVAIPAGTKVVADHPRRGLVLAVPLGTSAATLATFLLDAASELTAVPLGDRWIAEVYAA